MQFYTDGPVPTELATCLDGRTAFSMADFNLFSSQRNILSTAAIFSTAAILVAALCAGWTNPLHSGRDRLEDSIPVTRMSGCFCAYRVACGLNR